MEICCLFLSILVCLFILAFPGLSGGTWDFRSSLWHVGSSSLTQGSNPGPLPWELGVLATQPWTIPFRLLCPWGFSRQEYRSGLPYPLPGDIPNQGIEPRSPTLHYCLRSVFIVIGLNIHFTTKPSESYNKNMASIILLLVYFNNGYKCNHY